MKTKSKSQTKRQKKGAIENVSLRRPNSVSAHEMTLNML